MIVDFQVVRTTQKAKDWDWVHDKDIFVFAIKKKSKLFEAVLIRYPCDDYGEMRSLVDNSDKAKMKSITKLFKDKEKASNWLYSQMLLEGLL